MQIKNTRNIQKNCRRQEDKIPQQGTQIVTDFVVYLQKDAIQCCVTRFNCTLYFKHQATWRHTRKSHKTQASYTYVDTQVPGQTIFLAHLSPNRSEQKPLSNNIQYYKKMWPFLQKQTFQQWSQNMRQTHRLEPGGCCM